jgi:glutamate-1-semialdehyde aminotransferase
MSVPDQPPAGDGLTLPNGAERSEALHRSANGAFPGGVSHDIRYFDPHPTDVDHVEGPHLRDVDGNEYVDFCNDLTSVLGHAHPAVTEAVHELFDAPARVGLPGGTDDHVHAFPLNDREATQAAARGMRAEGQL